MTKTDWNEDMTGAGRRETMVRTGTKDGVRCISFAIVAIAPLVARERLHGHAEVEASHLPYATAEVIVHRYNDRQCARDVVTAASILMREAERAGATPWQMEVTRLSALAAWRLLRHENHWHDSIPRELAPKPTLRLTPVAADALGTCGKLAHGEMAPIGVANSARQHRLHARLMDDVVLARNRLVRAASVAYHSDVIGIEDHALCREIARACDETTLPRRGDGCIAWPITAATTVATAEHVTTLLLRGVRRHVLRGPWSGPSCDLRVALELS